MKRSDLTRKTPLEAKSEMRRTSALNRSSASPARGRAKRSNLAKRLAARPAVPARIHAALAARSGGLCEMALPGCTGIAVDPAHRVRTGMGGRKGATKEAHDVLSNLIHACRRDHEWTHREPAMAYALGLMLRDGSDPLKEPALIQGRWVLLSDDGSYSPIDCKED